MNQIDSDFKGKIYDKPVEFTKEEFEIIWKVLEKIPMNLIDVDFVDILKLMPKVSRKIVELSGDEDDEFEEN